MALDHESVRSLTTLMGPWFVLDEQTPTAPGVHWQKFLSLIEKGKITPGVVVRGPATGGLWMPAYRAPSVATQLGLCWSCQSPLPPDPNLTECPQCQRRLNGPVNWPDAGPADPADQASGESAGIEDADAASAIDDLIEASAGRAGGNGYANVRPSRSGAALLVATLIAAASICVAGIFYGATRILDGRRADPPPAQDWRFQPDAGPEMAVAPAPAGAQPGELFPEVPAYAEPGPTKRTVRDQRALAQARFDQAGKYIRKGDLLAAQDVLVDMVNTCDPAVLPDGAKELLQAVRNRIRTSTRPTDVPDKAELQRQKRSARTLLHRAERLIAEGNLLGAQKPLLEILNTHHPNAWPAGTLERFQDVKDGLRGAATSRPEFFGIEARK
ncbi:MAG: hypothetical protein ACYS5V_00765 [Planctomycetota bacterium]|jgi:hypothetical protein